MRDVKAIDLGEGRSAVLRELRVRDVRRVLALATPEQLKRPVPELIREHLPELLDLLGESLTLPEGEATDDLSLSECEAIGTAWWEMHKRFFAPLVALAEKALAAAGTPGMLPPSTAPASSASSADIATSGTTAGASSTHSST